MTLKELRDIQKNDIKEGYKHELQSHLMMFLDGGVKAVFLTEDNLTRSINELCDRLYEEVGIRLTFEEK